MAPFCGEGNVASIRRGCGYAIRVCKYQKETSKMKIRDEQLQAFLEDAGSIAREDLERVVQEAKASNTPLGEALLRAGVVADTDLRKMYSLMLGIPFVNLEKNEIPTEILHIIPAPIAKKYNIVAFERTGEELKVAMLSPDDLQTIDFIQKKTGLRIVPCLTSQESIHEILKQYEKSLQAEFGDIIDKDAESLSEKATSEQPKEEGDSAQNLAQVAEDVPVVRIVDTLLKHAVLQQASDIHIEPIEKGVIVRYRIDGVLHDAMNLPKSVHQGVVARIKVMSNLKLDEHRLPQDGRFKIETDGYKISFRVSILPIFDGEKVVMRLLDESAKGLTLEKIGFEGRDLDVMHREIKKPNGMVLVTGPTGSGKTTTLYTVVDILNTPEVNISTVEDPVEYRMERINQTQVISKIGMTFAAALRALLRQDPDIIMVGEIRDTETLEIAMHAAMTGHLVLSTLHTNSASATISRMVDMGAEPFLVASTLNVIIAQRLVRRLCSDCRKPYTLGDEELKTLQDNFDLDAMLSVIQKSSVSERKKIQSWQDIEFYRASGCGRCGNEGYRGRSGVFEVLEVSEVINKLIIKGASPEEIEIEARREGMHTMIEDGCIKAALGITSLEEVLRVTKE